MRTNFRPVRITAQLVIVVTAATMLVACTPRRTELLVHNRTTSPIVFTEMTTTNVVPACSTRRYDWTGAGWKSVDPAESESPGPEEAIPVRISAAPADAARQTVVIVTAENVNGYVPAEAPSPPPCAGVPPAPSSRPSASNPLRTG